MTKEIIPESINIQKIIEGLKSGHYAIPVFQREFVWDINNIKSLWDSIYRHYPIGSFLIWETDEKLPRHRKLLDIELKSTERGTFNYILDGQQRITSLISSIMGAKLKNRNLTIYFDLEKAFEDSKKDSVTSNSPFIDEKELQTKPLTSKDLFIPVSKIILFDVDYYTLLIERNKKELAKFYHEISDKINNNYKLSLIRLSKIPLEEIPEIFTRINQKGKKLSLIELITAKTFKQDEFYLQDYLDGEDEFKEKSFEYVLDKENYSGLDQEIILRIISVNDKQSCKEKELLALTHKKIVEFWNPSLESLVKAIRFLKKELNVQNPNMIPYPPMVIPLSYFFFKLKNKNLDIDICKLIKEWFWINSFTGNYQGATLEKIHKDCSWFDKLLNGERKLNVKFSQKIEKQELIEQELSLTSAFSKSILCLFANLRPIDFGNHDPININEFFIKSKKEELHHIFPKKSEVGKRHGEQIKSIVNVCFISKNINQIILNKNPSRYIAEFKKSNKFLEGDLKTHLISLELLEKDNYSKFLEERAEEIKKQIYTLCGIINPLEEEIEKNPNSVIDKYEFKVRELINDILSEEAEDYWNTLIPSDIVNSVKLKLDQELKKKPFKKEEFKEPLKKLGFLDIMDYYKIISSNFELFKEIFGSEEELKLNFLNLKNLRNPLKHNRKLDEIDGLKGRAALLWLDSCMNIQEEIIDENLEQKEEESLTNIFEDFKKGILSFGKDITFIKNKYYWAFRRSNNFVSLKIQTNKIKIYFRMPANKLEDPLKLVRDVSNVGHHGTGNYEFSFSCKEDLPYILKIMRMAYELDGAPSENYDLKHHLSKIRDSVTESRVNELINKVSSLSKDIRINYSKLHIIFSKKTAFFSIYCQKNQFWADLKLSKKEITNKDLDIRPHKDEVWTHIRVSNQVNLESLMPFIKEALDKKEKKNV